jgi:hypothetical protein
VSFHTPNLAFENVGSPTELARFSQADIHDLAPQLLHASLTKIESAGTAEKVAENDHLMKCERLNFGLAAISANCYLRCHAGNHHSASDSNTVQRLVAILGVHLEES